MLGIVVSSSKVNFYLLAFAQLAEGFKMGPTLMSIFIEYLLPVLATGIAAVVGLLLKNWADKLKSDANASAVKHALSVVVEKAGYIVTRIEQTERKSLIEATKDGKLSPDEKQQLKNRAMADLLKLAAEELGVISPDNDSAQRIASAVIEAQVAKLSRNTNGVHRISQTTSTP